MTAHCHGAQAIGVSSAIAALLVIGLLAPREAAASHLAAIQTLSLRKTDFLLPRLWGWLQSDWGNGKEEREVRQLDQLIGRKLR